MFQEFTTSLVILLEAFVSPSISAPFLVFFPIHIWMVRVNLWFDHCCPLRIEVSVGPLRMWPFEAVPIRKAWVFKVHQKCITTWPITRCMSWAPGWPITELINQICDVLRKSKCISHGECFHREWCLEVFNYTCTLEHMEIRISCRQAVEKLWKSCRKAVEKL